MKGGNVLGNGTWINVGGNVGVTYGGLTAANQSGGGPYDDPDGRQSFVIPFPSIPTTRANANHLMATLSIRLVVPRVAG